MPAREASMNEVKKGAVNGVRGTSHQSRHSGRCKQPGTLFNEVIREKTTCIMAAHVKKAKLFVTMLQVTNPSPIIRLFSRNPSCTLFDNILIVII